MTLLQLSSSFLNAWTSVSLALSEMNALMTTWSSTVPITELSIAEPMTNRPMMNSERKIVMTAPSEVVQLRKKWLRASLSE